MREATHVIWTTGGRFFPDDEFERYLRRGAKAGTFQTTKTLSLHKKA